MDTEKIRKHLKAFSFTDLFNELGWERVTLNHSVMVNHHNYTLRAVAEKRTFAVLVCAELPDRTTRMRIEREATKNFHENLLIFYNPEKTEQRWLWTKREVGKPVVQRERFYQKGQTGESIVQALGKLEFLLREEEFITIVDVNSRFDSAFNRHSEQVTKKFYDRFKNEHDVFMGFINGIPDQELQAWYASVMLNRLMFVYFIQNKNFLNNDTSYLKNHLSESQGDFYREFLIPLFFDGFSSQNKSPEIHRLLGDIPYLNGGIFMPHSIEQTYGATINIPDEAFKKIFTFFDTYHWHLDERALKDDDEINPDVLGYIFEKYINRKQMGAYYTKEDITEYITKNTIIPFLFDQAQKSCAVAFEGNYSVWRIVKDEPDRYIHRSISKGAELELPLEIAKGLEDISQREYWNYETPDDYGLPTELWRETIARRERYAEVKGKLERGEVHSIGDFINYNLDIRQFAQDVILNAESTDLVKAFWNAVTTVTVLDPTCGSGAFLFSALNVLEPLYEACLERMAAYLGEPERGERYAEFEEIDRQIAEHPNTEYFIYKRIILNNIYGVDIMEEAIEICKLRLFLKLVAQEDDPKKIEPLPDIDFNIRVGNTLVGFATEREIFGRLFATPELKQQVKTVSSKLKSFRDLQTQVGVTAESFKKSKKEAQDGLVYIRDMLDESLIQDYGLSDLKQFRHTHKPFHWYLEFHSVLDKGGFDVIIGNPPYVEYSKVKNEYTVRGYKTEGAGNLYAFVMERAGIIQRYGGILGLIVPVSFLCTERMIPLQDATLFNQGYTWLSSFDTSPSQLFSGVSQRLTIVITKKYDVSQIFLGGYRRWHNKERNLLLNLTSYTLSDFDFAKGYVPKMSKDIEKSVWGKMKGAKLINYETSTSNKLPIYVHRIIRYFVKAIDFIPYFWNEKEGVKKSEDYKPFFFREDMIYPVISIINSSVFYWYWHTFSDGFHCGYRDVRAFPIKELDESTVKQLDILGKKLMEDIKRGIRRRTSKSKSTGQVEYDEFNPRLSKPIIDEIDRVLAQHYGFADEEADFIINYDIKYRIGDELDVEGGDE
jgi:hypothetical protein